MALADYVENKPVIETERLRLRPMTPSDVPALRAWMPDKGLYTYWGKGPSKAEKNPELLFEKEERAVRSFHLGIAERETNAVIGDIWVYRIEHDRMASVALRLAASCQGKGYGTESLSAMTRFCFGHTELRRLWTEVDVRNTASCRMLEKCGYTREGLIRQGRMVNTWCDHYIYGILADDGKKPAAARQPCGDYRIIDGAEHMDVADVVRLLRTTYWADKRPVEQIEASLRHSACYGVALDGDDRLVGFARVISDYATTFYLCDVVVDPAYRGRGLGTALVSYIDARFAGLRGVLITRDAHALYRKFGYTVLNDRAMVKQQNC